MASLCPPYLANMQGSHHIQEDACSWPYCPRVVLFIYLCPCLLSHRLPKTTGPPALQIGIIQLRSKHAFSGFEMEKPRPPRPPSAGMVPKLTPRAASLSSRIAGCWPDSSQAPEERRHVRHWQCGTVVPPGPSLQLCSYAHSRRWQFRGACRSSSSFSSPASV